jgi:hypothetical protein
LTGNTYRAGSITDIVVSGSAIAGFKYQKDANGKTVTQDSDGKYTVS